MTSGWRSWMPPHTRRRCWHGFAAVAIMANGDRVHWGYFLTRRGVRAWCAAAEEVFDGGRFYWSRLPRWGCLRVSVRLVRRQARPHA